jgi:hypothetical protein
MRVTLAFDVYGTKFFTFVRVAFQQFHVVIRLSCVVLPPAIILAKKEEAFHHIWDARRR